MHVLWFSHYKIATLSSIFQLTFLSLEQYNIKDFPQKYLTSFSIKVIHPDDFIVELIHQDKEAALRAFDNQVANLKYPPMTEKEVLNSLMKCGLKKSVNLLSDFVY